MEAIIKAENISLSYDLGKSNESQALKDINIEIYPEEYVIFFGPSGCGKSTLLYVIAGLMRPTGGNIWAAGRELTGLSEMELVAYHRATIGMIFQAYYLIPYLNARDNVMMPQIFLNALPEVREKKADVLLERFGLSQVSNRRSVMLSGGQQQRVAIARALINDAPIILADEPTGNLDSKNAAAVLDLVSELNKKDKKTIIHVTHDPSHLAYADRVFYMRDGKIERIAVNEKKAAVKAQVVAVKEGETIPPAMPESELDKLARIFPHLSEARLKAKLYANHLLLPCDMDALEQIEESIEKYILNQIGDQELMALFDVPIEKGGAGLNFQTAKNLAKDIIGLAAEARALEAAKTEPVQSPKSRGVLLREYLLDNHYGGHITYEQLGRLDRGIDLRLSGKFNREDLRKFLDAPLEEGGVGLNSRTARKFALETEILLAKKDARS